MENLVEKLRHFALYREPGGAAQDALMHEAADTIERLSTARNKALEEVLRLIESSYSMNPEKDKPLFALGIEIQRLMVT